MRVDKMGPNISNLILVVALWDIRRGKQYVGWAYSLRTWTETRSAIQNVFLKCLPLEFANHLCYTFVLTKWAHNKACCCPSDLLCLLLTLLGTGPAWLSDTQALVNWEFCNLLPLLTDYTSWRFFEWVSLLYLLPDILWA